MPSVTTARESATHTKLRIGSVSFLNAKPLIYGLDEHRGVQLRLDVPSALLGGLREKRFDVALLPVIDYQRLDGLRLITSGGIACDGPTLTVRIFSRTPISQIRVLACDTDSHTSVALARVLLAEVYGISPRFVSLSELDGAGADEPARLLIGDKVVCEEPAGFPHQLDLGEAWKRHTGLPFVFAAWMARDGVDLGDLPARLEAAKREGLRNIAAIVAEHAIPRGWPAEIARRYLTDYLRFDVGPRQIEAICLFHAKALQHGVIDRPPTDLELYSA